MFKKLLIIFVIIVAASIYACTDYAGTGGCVADSTNGCHVPQSTTCRVTTPDGIRCLTCNGSCPTQGYYVPFGNATAWNAFKTYIPGTMTNGKCLSPTSSSSTSSSSTGCMADGTICGFGGTYGSYNDCTTCCNGANVGTNGLIGCSGGTQAGNSFTRCGDNQLIGCISHSYICSGGSCFDY